MIEGLTIHDYFMAHAPLDPTWEFKPEMEKKRPYTSLGGDEERKTQSDWDTLYRHEKYRQWPREWADEQIKQRNIEINS